MLSDETVEKFRKIFRKDYGVEYTKQEAYKAAHNLVGFFKLLNKIDRENKKRDK